MLALLITSLLTFVTGFDCDVSALKGLIRPFDMTKKNINESVSSCLTPLDLKEAPGTPIYYFGETIPLGKRLELDSNPDQWFRTTGSHLAFRYQTIALLGEGSGGYVMKAHDRRLDEMVVFKIAFDKQEKYLRAEYDAAHELTEEGNVLKDGTPASRHITAPVKMGHARGKEFVIFPYRPTCLFNFGDNFLARQKETGQLIPMFEWLWLRKFTLKMVQVLEHINRKGKTHCDLKPENILLHADGDMLTSLKEGVIAEVTDFGLCLKKGCTSRRGTHGYIAPERYNRSPADGSTDMFSLGAILFELGTTMEGNRSTYWELLPGWYHHGKRDYRRHILYEVRRFNPPKIASDPIVDDYLDFVVKAMDPHPKMRLSFAQAYAHPFLSTIPSSESNPSPSP
jgi:serine/threonine protein kinase